ncbi:MAG: hypothetical protein ACREC4_00400 [Methylocella sp.]
MPDINQWWGNDISASASGDLLTVDGLDRGRQRILRRLLTNSNNNGFPSDYLWHPTYGAGCPHRVGETRDINEISAAIRSQIMAEASVAKQPLPEIAINPIDSGVFVSVRYVDAETGEQAYLSFNITE